MTGAVGTAGRLHRAWPAYLALGLLAVGGYSFLPSGSVAAFNTYTLAVGASAVLAIMFGIRCNRPVYARPWYFVLAGGATLLAADAIYGYYEVVLGEESPYPSIAEVFYLGTYVLWAAGLNLMVHARTATGDRGNILDATIIATGVGVVSWVYLVEPRIEPSMGLVEMLFSIAYPLMDVLLLALVARLLFSPGVRPWSFYFVCVSLVSTLISDVLFGIAEANETYATGSFVDNGWLLAYVMWGVAALHPSMRTLTEPDPKQQARLTGSRIVLLAAASLLAPAVLAVEYLRGGSINVPVFVGGTVVLFLLSLARVNGLVRMLERAARKYRRAVERERILRKAASESAAALDRESIYSAALKAAKELMRGTPRSSVILALGSAESMRVAAATGPDVARVACEWLAGLPDTVVAALRKRQPTSVKWGEGSGAETREVYVAPLVVQEEVRGAILAVTDQAVPEEARWGLESLGSQLALALESATLAEDLRQRQNEKRFHSLVQNASDLITIQESDGTFRFLSPSYERVLGHRPEDLVGTNALSLVHPDDAERARKHFTRVSDTPGISPPIELRMRHENGSWRHLEAIANNLLDDPDVLGVVVNSRDVTGRRRAEALLTHQAFHDPLTELPNRALFLDRLGHALVRAEGRGGCVAVLFLDLDRFKIVNDSLGHDVGDRLLSAVGKRLRNNLRPEDTVARLGGDEFTILLEDVKDARYPHRVAERVSEALRAPFGLEGQEIIVTASIGVVLNAPGDSPSDLLRDADIAMYQAKDGGKARYAIFDASMKMYAFKRLNLENELRRAIENRELRVYYQPEIEFDSGRIKGMEALVRWKHPEHGLVSPAEFIPLAEETGLIVPLGQYVLEEACRQAKEWQDHKPSDGSPLMINVNLSARQFQQPDLVEEVAQVLKSSRLEPDYLVLEITESVLMENVQASIEILQGMKDLGIKLAIDDFGTGYSSLAYLKRFPIDILKIDKSFVGGLGKDPGDTAIVQSVITLAGALRLEAVAEGIETDEQASRLRSLGCKTGQGYLFAKPLSNEEATKLLVKSTVFN